ncbi:hypothetical protein JNUCC74_15365 [Cerasibacillus sp. JNUCC 74]
MRTASIVAAELAELGFELKMKKAVMSPEHCMGKPAAEVAETHDKWALEHGIDNDFIIYFSK